MKFIRSMVSVILCVVMSIQFSGVVFAEDAPLSGDSNFLVHSSEAGNEWAAKIDTYVKPYILKTTPGCEIAIVSDGDIVFNGGYGVSDVDKMESVDPEKTIFNYASVGKMFIWVSAMQLVEQKRLDLDKDIREYLPEGYPIKIKDGSKVTMLNLMNHNAGFDAACSSIGEPADRDAGSIGKAVSDFYDSEQCFREGTICSYSNYSSNLAAYIIECITHMNFYEYVEENIFKPCSMNTFYPEKTPRPELMKYKAKGYTCVSEERFEEAEEFHRYWLYPSGAAVGTAKDLALFAKALMPKEGEQSPLFENNSTIKEMFSRSYETVDGEEIFSIHHGFWGSNGCYKGIGHSGGIPGFTTQFVLNLETSFAMVSLTNSGEMYAVTRLLAEELTGSDYDKPDTDLSELPDSKDVSGEYFHARGRFHGEGEPPRLFKITSHEENMLNVDNGSSTILFKQIRPYLYMAVSCDPLQEEYRSKMYFTVRDGKVIKATMIHSDLIPCDCLEDFICTD